MRACPDATIPASDRSASGQVDVQDHAELVGGRAARPTSAPSRSDRERGHGELRGRSIGCRSTADVGGGSPRAGRSTGRAARRVDARLRRRAELQGSRRGARGTDRNRDEPSCTRAPGAAPQADSQGARRRAAAAGGTAMMDRDLRLSAYVDGELDAEQTREVERQLASDPQAREMVRIHRETTELLRAACAPSFYPETGRRFRDMLQRRRPGWPSIPTMALAASLLAGVIGLATGVVIGSGQLTETASLLEEIATYHQVFARETEHLVEVPAARRADLTAWLGDRLGR